MQLSQCLRVLVILVQWGRHAKLACFTHNPHVMWWIHRNHMGSDMYALFNDALHQMQQLHITEWDVRDVRDTAGNDNSWRLWSRAICVRVVTWSELLKCRHLSRSSMGIDPRLTLNNELNFFLSFFLSFFWRDSPPSGSEPPHSRGF